MGSIEVGRFSDLLRRMFSMVGQLEVAAELSPEVSPTVELESAQNQEWDFLKGVKQCATSEEIAANAGAGGQFRLRNPPDSGTLATVHEKSAAGTMQAAEAIQPPERLRRAWPSGTATPG